MFITHNPKFECLSLIIVTLFAKDFKPLNSSHSLVKSNRNLLTLEV